MFMGTIQSTLLASTTPLHRLKSVAKVNNVCVAHGGDRLVHIGALASLCCCGHWGVGGNQDIRDPSLLLDLNPIQGSHFSPGLSRFVLWISVARI